MAEIKKPASPHRGYLINCVRFFFEKNLILNHCIDKEVARELYRKEYIGERGIRYKFATVLNGWRTYGINLSRGRLIHFKESILNEILHDKNTLNVVTVKKNKTKVKNCKTCSIQFRDYTEYQRHIKRDKKHKFRQLYFTNSTKLNSRDFIIKISKEQIRETMVLRRNISSNTNLYIKNNSSRHYVLNDIAELHERTQEFSIAPVKFPVFFIPHTEVTLHILSCFRTNNSQFFAFIFTFLNLETQKLEHVLKEIDVQIMSQSLDHLLSTAPYSKLKPIGNDISTSNFIEAYDLKPACDYVSILKAYNIPAVLQRILRADLKPYKGIKPDEQDYLNDTKKTLKSARNLGKDNHYEVFKLLLYLEEYQLCRNIRNYDSETKITKCKGYSKMYQLQVPELAETRPSLLPGDSVYLKESSKQSAQTFQGVVKDIREDHVVLTFSNAFGNGVYEQNKLFSVRYGFNRNVIRAEQRGIELLHKRKATAHLFPTSTGNKYLKDNNITWLNANIKNNREQQTAVLHVLAKTAYPAPYLIFGPPGTGKTMTVVEAISQIWKQKPKDKILVCTPSNSMANEIACRLVKYIPHTDIFRYLAYSFQLRDVPDIIMPCVNYDDEEYFHPTLKDLLQYRIVITTLLTASRLVSLGVPAQHFSYIFIDESGQAKETEAIIPISLLTANNKKGALLGQVILAGDPQQLGPIILSPFAKEHGLGQSMLERMMTTLDLYKRKDNGAFNTLALTKLLFNYRSHPAILTIPNKLFYENELIPKGDSKINLAVNWKHLPNPKVPLIFHGIIGTDQREKNSPSYFNIQEIEIVINYLNLLIGKCLKDILITEEDIGIITPYRKQVQKIREVCAKKGWNSVAVGSVEQFQGREKLIIIISTVRSQPQLLKFDHKFHLGFLNNPKRFNVAITRAKALLIVTGNPNLLQRENYWKDFIKYCKDQKCYTGSESNFSNNEDLVLRMAKISLTG